MGRESPPLGIEELIRRFHPLLYRYAYRLSGSRTDAEDLTQQTYLIAHQSLHQLREESKAKSWLCTILRHAYLRSDRRQIASLASEAGHDPIQPMVDIACDEEAVQAALQQLPEEYRSPAILFYFQELSYKEIAEALESPIGTVMSRLSRAKQHLKRLLEPREPVAASGKSLNRVTRSATSTPRSPVFVD